MIPTHRAPTHPGEILLEEYLKPLAMTQATAAEKMGVSRNRLNELVVGKRGVTADTALRLATLCKTSPEFWMNLQAGYDLYHAKRELVAALRGKQRYGTPDGENPEWTAEQWANAKPATEVFPAEMIARHQARRRGQAASRRPKRAAGGAKSRRRTA